jgi:Ca-activated chloride channel homolog
MKPILAAYRTSGYRFTRPLSLGALGLSVLILSVAYGQECLSCSSFPSSADVATAGDFWVIKKHVNEVNLWFTASTHGKFIADLTKDDITIRDEGEIPTAIVAFHSQHDLPLRVGLLVDTSGSVKERFRFEQAAATGFLREAIREPQDLAFVMGFANHPALTQDLTNDAALLSAGVAALKPVGGTALFDAVVVAAQKLVTTSEEPFVAKVLVVLSDGDDNGSKIRLDAAIAIAQQENVVIYTINTNPPTSDTWLADSHKVGDTNMKRLAEQTGGRAFRPESARVVAKAFAKVQRELRCRYAVSYRPPDFVADGRYRRIKIVAHKRGKNLQVHTRSGYYARSSALALATDQK